jgi:hypothetical protein
MRMKSREVQSADYECLLIELVFLGLVVHKAPVCGLG